MLAEGHAVVAFVEIDQPEVDFNALFMSLADQVFHQVEIAIARRDELREALAVPHHVAAALLAAHHELVDVGALELRDKGADGIDGGAGVGSAGPHRVSLTDRKSTRLNSSHLGISYAVFCLPQKAFIKLVAALHPSLCHLSTMLALTRRP